MQRSFCFAYMQAVYSLVAVHILLIYATAWGICFSVHFYNGVCRYQLYDERDKSLRFSCIVIANTF